MRPLFFCSSFRQVLYKHKLSPLPVKSWFSSAIPGEYINIYVEFKEQNKIKRSVKLILHPTSDTPVHL